MSGFPLPLFLTCTTRPSRASSSPLPANFPFLVLIGSPILLPLVLLFRPRRVDLLVPPTERKEGQTYRCLSFNFRGTIDLLQCSCVQLFCSFCLFPNSCNQRFRKFYPPLVIVHSRPGSRQVVRPSVVMILVSFTCSSHTCDES